jgi:hypothetical protein
MSLTERISAGFQTRLLGCASFLIPQSMRQEWMCEWLGELWHVRKSVPSICIPWLFCIGSVSDAWFIMRHSTARCERNWLQSPWSCLFLLFGTLIPPCVTAICLPGSRTLIRLAMHTDLRPFLGPLHFQVSGSPPNPVDQQILLLRVTLILSWLVLTAVNTNFHFALQIRTKDLRALALRLRWAAFLCAKLLMIIPLVFLSELDVAQMIGARYVGFAEMAVSVSGLSLLFRWAVQDQRLRCPECLSRVQHPVQVGNAAHLLLDTQVTEYVCPRDHGFLQFDHETVDDLPHSRWIGMQLNLEGR